jgi:hypothetical protein
MSRNISNLAVLAAALLVSVVLGCGTHTPVVGPVKGEFTTVTPLLSSSANDELSAYFMTIESIALTNQAGGTVKVFNTPQWVEWIGLNGGSAPLASASLAQGVYTSATVTYQSPTFTCLFYNASNGDDTSSTYAGASGTATVNLASPITISGNAMDLSLILDVPQSFTLPGGCAGATSHSLTPAFTLSPLTIANPPTNDQNGKETGIDGSVVSVNSSGTTTGNSFSLLTTTASTSSSGGTGSPLSVAVNAGTVYQGISGFSALSANMFVDMDADVQPNGSLLATRVAVYDPTAVNRLEGPLYFVGEFVGQTTPVFYILGRQAQGSSFTTLGTGVQLYTDPGTTVFQTSGQFSNLASLPFVPSFNASNMVAGQNVAVYSQVISTISMVYTHATTITLMPQTIDGTVTAISTSGSFTTYTVTLAPYDLFPIFAVQQGRITNPNTVVVYAGSDTLMLNSTPVAIGGVIRFNGLIFNDNGALRMDCAQINDGVPE